MTAKPLSIGEKLPGCEIKISQPLIDAYAEISGDFNPLHVDVAAATATPFKGTIAHGCIPLDPLFQAVERWLGVDVLPRETRINMRYLAPSRPGDAIRVDAQVSSEKSEGSSRFAVISFACLNQHDEKVLAGECVCPLESA